MATREESIDALELQELLAFAERLGKEPAGETALMTLTASGDPAARERGFLAGLRAALGTAVEPGPPNLHNAWGDWPHSLFAQLQPGVATAEGLGIAAYAWADGRRETVTTAVPLQGTAYYLNQPVTFPLLHAAESLLPVVAVELHRSFAEVRQFSGPHGTLVARTEQSEDGRVPHSGRPGMEHSDRHEDESINRHLARVADEVRSVAEASAIVVSGSESLRSAFLRLLGPRLPIAEIDRNPDDDGSVVASRIAEAGMTAVQARRMSEVTAALATGAALTDWATVVAEAAEGRLHEIWMDPSLALHVYRCGSCAGIVEGSSACSQCGADVWNRLPLPEVIVRFAARTRAALHFTELSSTGGLSGTGIVAVTRY